MRGARRIMPGAAAAIIVAAAPVASAANGTLVTATTSNPSPLAISVGRYSLVAVTETATSTNPQSPLTVTLDASNGRGQFFLLRNFGELDVTAFTIGQSMTSNIGAASATTSYCAGGSSGGTFTSIGVCAGGGTLTRAVAGSQSALVTLTIPAGSSRQVQVATQSPTSGKDNVVTISVSVAGSGVKSQTARHS